MARREEYQAHMELLTSLKELTERLMQLFLRAGHLELLTFLKALQEIVEHLVQLFLRAANADVVLDRRDL